MAKVSSGGKILVGVVLILVLALLSGPMASAQEITGGIKAIVKDKTGASIPNATVDLTGAGLLVPRKLMSDAAGEVHFAQVPPGEYALEASAPNFRTVKVSGIMLDVGKEPTFNLVMEVGEVTQTIEVTSSAVLIDVTASNVSTAIPEEVIDNIPKGRSYQSLIPFSPGARQEPLQSSRVDRNRSDGFQIDGASDSENTYLVEGLDTSNIQNGGVKQGVDFEFVQEVQIKTSGVQAEYGGAMGGVVNVIQKRGSNQWHGGLLTYYEPSAFDSNDICETTPQPRISESIVPSGTQLACGLRQDPATTFSAGTRTDQAANYYIEKKDQYYTVEPGYEIGGPILKDKLWIFSSYIPSINEISRTVNFTGAVQPGPHTFNRSDITQNMLNRLDYQPFTKLHLFAGWQYGYGRIRGQLPTLPDSVTGQANPIAANDPTSFRPDTGSVNPSNIFNFGGEWTPNAHTVVTTRYGYFYYNSEDRGLPAGIRDVYQQTLAVGTTTSPIFSTPTPLIPTSSSPFASSAGGLGFANISANLTTLHDAFSRKGFSTDVSYFLTKWGTHNFKAGYGFNKQANDVFQGINTALINVFWGYPYVPSPNGGPGCAAVEAYNTTNYPGNNGVCSGTDGYFTIMDGITTVGVASSYNHSIYVQDGWTIGHGLTLNLGVRMDKEYLPPYSAGNPSISFGFGDKVAPRLGAAYDLFHNGKVKLFGDYGKFYDIMKYSLPRGSFGGEYWHDCVYALYTLNLATIQPTSPGGHSCGPSDGTPAPGVSNSANYQFIENINWRAPAGDPQDPGVDPNIKPMSQHEMTLGGDWAITPLMGLEVRYSRKRLDNAIDDQSIDDSTYYIGNPGPNTYSNLLHRPLPGAGYSAAQYPNGICPTCPPAPRAQRRYDGIETRLTYRRSNLFGQLSYTFSHLDGNYSGLTDTDVTDASGGRHNANNNRSFDLPEMQYTTSGKVMDGPLSTDRPNVLTMVGYYNLKWWGMETTFGVNQTFAEGSPKSTCVPVVDSTSSCQYWDQRGEFANIHRDTSGNLVLDSVTMGARMPMYAQTDFNFKHTVHVNKSNEAETLGFEWNVLNLLNNASVLAVNPDPFASTNEWISFPTSNTGFLQALSGYNPISLANTQGLTYNNRYGLPFLYQNRRTMRMAVRFTF